MTFPRITIILRGYDQSTVEFIAETIVQNHLEDYFSLEITMNTESALESIKSLNDKYQEKLKIGAGTVLNLEEAKNAIKAGAQFILSPIKLSEEILKYCKSKNVLTVPAAFSPTEVWELYQQGADIIKVFPASSLATTFCKDIQAPLGSIPLMAVGGINMENSKDYLSGGASFLGIGSSMFDAEKLKARDKSAVKERLNKFKKIVDTL